MKLRLIAVALGLICACTSRAQTTYQPNRSHVAYGDGSTDFYWDSVTNPNPSNGQGADVSFTVFFNCRSQSATVFNAGVMTTVSIDMTCLTPPEGGTVMVVTGGKVQINGMTVTINPSSWTIVHNRGGESVTSFNVPLTVQ